MFEEYDGTNVAVRATPDIEKSAKYAGIVFILSVQRQVSLYLK